MIKNYFKTAIRFLLKNRTFSFINLIGLSLGTLCCLYILLYLQEQYSYDRWEDHASDIYRVNTDMKLLGDRHHMARTSPPIAATMKRDFPEVEQYTRAFDAAIFGADQHLFKYKDRSFYERQTLYVDSTFFQVFNFHFLRGDAARCLMQPFTAVLTKTTADKLFGNEDPMGKVVHINDKAGEEDLKVTGVIDDQDVRSTLAAHIYITLNSGLIGRIIAGIDTWAGGNMMYSYVKLRPGADTRALEAKLTPFVNRYGAVQLKNIGMTKQLELQPVSTVHTTAGYEGEWTKTLSPVFLKILSLIAILIQVIACINFMNLSTARASRRAKEVGVRKVIGAGRLDLVRQFLGESFLLALLGVVFALPLLTILLPYLNELTQADISLSFIRDYRIWLVMLALVFGTGLLAGSYPAFYLSAFQIVKVIKGNFTSKVSVAGLRRSLVVFQFSLSIILITGIVVIYSQLSYIRHKDLGFEKSQKLIFNVYTVGVNQKAIMEQMRQLPGVKAVTKSNSELGKPIIQDRKLFLPGGNLASSVDAMDMITDEYFARAAGLLLVSGRDFHAFDSSRVLINETLARRLGIDPMKAEGRKIFSQWDTYPLETFEVAGVVKDFNTSSLHDRVNPTMIICDPNFHGSCSVMVNCTSDNYKSLIGQLTAIWKKNAPGLPFDYYFLDDSVQKQYETEITLSSIINSFTAMAIFISCLGLFGLAAFSAEQRSKEIGVRKVLGASVTGIVRLLSIDFLKLVGVALIISIPVSWWVMHRWLDGFAYRTDLRWWMFVLSGVAAIFIAAFTVGFHTIRAASVNPVKSLRSE